MHDRLFDQNSTLFIRQDSVLSLYYPHASTSGHTYPAERDKAPHVVNQIHHANFDLGTGQPNHSHEHATLLIGLRSKDMLSAHPDCRFPVIGLFIPVIKRPVTMAFLVKMAPIVRSSQHQFVFFAPVGAIGPDILGGVIPEQSIEHLRVMDLRRGDRVAADQLVLVIYADMVLVAVVGFAVLLGPTRIGVFLTLHMGVGLKSFRRLTVLDLVVFLTAIALFRCRDKTGINHLPLPGLEPLGFKLKIEVEKQRLDQLLLNQLFTKQPQGLGVGNLVFRIDAQESAKTVAITYLILQLVIRQVIEVLNDQRLEHQYRIKGLATRIALARLVANRLQCEAKIFPVDQSIEMNQWITFVQLTVAVVQIEEAWLHRYATLAVVLFYTMAHVNRNGQFLEVPPTQKYEIAGFVKNISNEIYLTNGVNVAAMGFTEAYYSRPREWGVSVKINF